MTIPQNHSLRNRASIPILLGLMGGLLFCLQYRTLVKFAVLSPGRSFGGPLRFYQAVAERVSLDFVDGALFGMVLLVGLALVGLEVHRHRLSQFFQGVFQSERRTRYLLLATSAVCARYYFGAGELSWAGDAPHHIALAWVTAEALARGEVPFWTYYFGAGSPYLQFYGPLFFYATALVDLLFRDIYLSLKLVLGGAHIASGLGMYLLARKVGCTRAAAFLAGLAYVLCFWHAQQVLVMGRFALGLFYALLPWPFIFFERLSTAERPLANAFAGGLALAALNYTHPGYGFFAVGLFGLYAALRLWSWARRPWRASALLLGCGLVLSAYLVFGMWVERGHTGLGEMEFGLALGGKSAGEGVPDPTWRHLLVWSNYRFWLFAAPDNWYGGYLGIALVLLGALGLWAACRRRSLRAVGICLLVSLSLALGHGLPPWRYIDVAQAMNSARFLLFVVFFLSLAVGLGTRELLRRRRATFALLLLVVCADLGPTTFQQPYLSAGTDDLDHPGTPWHPHRQAAVAQRVAGALPPYRIAWLRGAVSHFTAVGFLPYATRTPTPDVMLSGDLPAGIGFSQPLIDFAGRIATSTPRFEDLQHSWPFALARAGFAMLNVRHLILTWRDGSLRTLELADHSPILVSARSEGYAVEELGRVPYAGMAGRTPLSATDPAERAILRVLWTIEKTGVDIGSRRAARILLLGGDRRDLGGRPEVVVHEHRVENQRVVLEVETSRPCFARLAYAYYPYVDVLINGTKVQPLQTVGGFIALELGRGHKRIELVPRLSPLRAGLLWLNGLVLAAGLGAMWWERRFKKPI